MKTWFLCAAALSMLGVMACGSSSSGSGGGGTTTKTTIGGTATATDTTSGSTTTTDCAALASAECAQCCKEVHTAAQAQFIAYAVAACACAADAPCKTECAATLCASTPTAPSTECATCANGQGATSACVTKALSDCTGNTGCAPLLTCTAACPKT